MGESEGLGQRLPSGQGRRDLVALDLGDGFEVETGLAGEVWQGQTLRLSELPHHVSYVEHDRLHCSTLSTLGIEISIR